MFISFYGLCRPSNEKVCQFIGVVVADIPEAYGLVLSRDWSAKMNGYFASDWSHLWLPYKGRIYIPNVAYFTTTF